MQYCIDGQSVSTLWTQYIYSTCWIWLNQTTNNGTFPFVGMAPVWPVNVFLLWEASGRWRHLLRRTLFLGVFNMFQSFGGFAEGRSRITVNQISQSSISFILFILNQFILSCYLQRYPDICPYIYLPYFNVASLPFQSPRPRVASRLCHLKGFCLGRWHLQRRRPHAGFGHRLQRFNLQALLQTQSWAWKLLLCAPNKQLKLYGDI